jgi:hypothetical protein
MKVVTLFIEDELFEHFKISRDAYDTSIKYLERPERRPSSERKVFLHEINLQQLMNERPDLVAGIAVANDRWSRAVCDVVKAIESPPNDSSTPSVQLKNETREEWIRRQKGRTKKDTSGCLVFFMLLFAGFVTAGMCLFG